MIEDAQLKMFFRDDLENQLSWHASREFTSKNVYVNLDVRGKG